ncbi:MAG: DNA-binding transcriptional repressor FabR [Frankiales bacterium]|jgi:AcrR family transcriptional regulator|nr:DNA-binding transcriptional repressor FabR [Frankiales bacterium]
MTLPLPDRSARREVLLDAADRIVQRDGPAVSMASIAAEAGITKPILYRHFGDKGGLYAALAERHTDRLLGTLREQLNAPGTARERVERTVDAYLRVIEAEPQVYRFLVHSGDAHGQVLSFLNRLSALLAIGVAAELGLQRGSLRAEVWARGIVGMVQRAGDWWVDAPGPTRAEVGRELTQLLWGAYAAAAGAQH